MYLLFHYMLPMVVVKECIQTPMPWAGLEPKIDKETTLFLGFQTSVQRSIMQIFEVCSLWFCLSH
jgi:hypothetical protein